VFFKLKAIPERNFVVWLDQTWAFLLYGTIAYHYSLATSLMDLRHNLTQYPLARAAALTSRQRKAEGRLVEGFE
jgi:hypothetical protein